jgi:glycerophosphoryl diester phosphodiesterase
LLAYRALHPEVGDVTPQLIASVHKRGCLVNVYTVNQADVMRRLLSMQVDGIFTDDPVLARQVFASYRADPPANAAQPGIDQG